MDNGPITKDRYSNLFFNDGQWMTAKEFDGTLRYNWYIMGHVKTIDDIEEVIGYNVYKENELLNTSNFVEDMFYNDNVPEGSHTYEISAIYEGLCESNRTPFVVEMPQSPCESEFTLPIRENFEGTRFPSWCWESVYSEGGLPWERVSYSQYPETYPDEGEYFMEHPWWGDTAWYISPLFTTEKDSYRLSLLMRRDGEYEFTEDKLNIYLSETPDVTGLTPIYSIHRYTGFEPPEAEEGWYEYTIPLNLAGMNNAYVILEGYAPNGGNNVYIDDIKIYDPYACDPIENLKVEQPREGEVFLSWLAPLNEGLDGYKVTRDGEIIADGLETPYFTDVTSIGTHEYTVTALFSNGYCEESSSVSSSVDVVLQCDPIMEVTTEIIGSGTVQVNWVSSNALYIASYSIYRNGEHLTDVTDALQYVDENVSPGSHIYSVVVNYKDKPCQISDPVFSSRTTMEYCIPVTNLTTAVSDNEIALTWEYDGGEGFTDEIFFEGFDDGIIPRTWLNLDRDGDSFKWMESLDGHVFSATYIMLWSLHPDNWLVSCPIELPENEKQTLTYSIMTGSPVFVAEHYGVFISTTGTDYDDFTLLFEETLTANEVEWKSRSVDLTGYDGENVYIAFRHYNSSDQLRVVLDNVKVSSSWGVPSFDIYRNDLFLANVNETSYTDTNIDNNENYRYCVTPAYNFCTAEPVCNPVSISEIDITTLNVYPNPTKGELIVQSEAEKVENIRIFDVVGKLVYEKNGINATETTLDISKLANGTYYINVDGKTIKVIKH